MVLRISRIRCADLLLLEAGEAVQPQIENRLRLHFRDRR